MHVILYKRHKAVCPHKDDKNYRRCRCSVWMEWNVNGKQTRKSGKTFNWDKAQQKARAIEQNAPGRRVGPRPAPAEAKTVEQAIALFMDSKRGEDLAENTLYKHTLTLTRLQEFCDREGIYFVKDITLGASDHMAGRLAFRIPASQAQQPRAGESVFQILQ